MTPKMIALTKQQEEGNAFAKRPYRDSRGFLTVGWGRCLETVDLSEDEADLMFANDIRTAEAGLSNLTWWQSLDPIRRDVVSNMAFNIGLDGLLKFKHMIASIEAQDFDGAANAMLDSLWATQVKTRAITLAKIMSTGTLPQ
jgi:lysozyme